MRSKTCRILCKHIRQPFGIERRCLRSASNNQRREIQRFSKNAPKSERNPSLGRIFGQNRILKMCHASKFQFWPTKPLAPRAMTTKTFHTIHGAPTGPMVASESMGTHLFSVRKNSKNSENPKISVTSDSRKSSVP